MLDFLQDYPFVAIFIVYFLFRLLFGNKAKKAQQAQQAQQRKRTQQARSQTSAETKPRTIQQEIQDALEGFRSAMQEPTSQPMTLDQRRTSSLAEQSAEMMTSEASATSEAKEDPFAFHSLSENVPQRVDYDLKASAFEFRDAINEPEAQEYHLGGFGFHEVHGLSHDPSKPAPIAQSKSVATGLFSNIDEIRRAIIVNEILGRPKSLRSRR